MSFLDKNGLQTLTNKLVQGDAIKVASHRGHTVKNVIDNITRECENISTPNTMKIENRVNEFKIGQGRDVNVVEDIETGYSEIELQGKTWHNIHSLSKIEGTNNATVTNIDLNKLSFEVKYSNNTVGNTSNNRAVLFGDFKNKIKPSTKYTFIYKCILLENPHGESCQLDIAIDCWGQGLGLSPITYNTGDTFFVRKVNTSPSQENLNTISTTINFINSKGKNTKWKIEDFMILEGDYTQTPIEELPQYFTGIKSSFEDGIIDIDVQGKNLFDGKIRTFNINNSYIDNIGGHNNGRNNIPIKPNTSYTMTFETISGDSNIYIWNGNEKVLTIPSGKDTVSFRTPLECNSLSFYRSVADYTKDRLKYKIQLEENSKSTLYEPYYKKKISFNIEESLRSLPNGTCDEIRNNNGQWELVRRIGKVVFTGKSIEGWTRQSELDSENTERYFTSFVKPKIFTPIYCDSFRCGLAGELETITNVYVHNTVNRIDLKKLKTDTRWSDVTTLQNFLSKNPMTIYYELETPIITPIEPIKFETLPLGYISINSEIAPISHHKVELNRAGQIEIGIVEIASLKSRVEKLENFYDQYFLETQHKLSILNMDYILESEEI